MPSSDASSTKAAPEVAPVAAAAPSPRPPWLVFAARVLDKVPLKLCVVVVLLALYAKEFFPLSHFPMYAGAQPRSWVIYVTDGADQPLPLQDATGMRTAFLKKVYNQRLHQAQREVRGGPKSGKRLAAERTLEYLHRESGPRAATLPPVLRLWYLDMRRRGSKIEFKHTLLGEFRKP